MKAAVPYLKIMGLALLAVAGAAYFQRNVKPVPVVGAYLPR